MSPERLKMLRSKIDDPRYIDNAVNELAEDLIDGRILLEEPTYGGRTAKIIFHIDEGRSPKEIAKLLDMSVNHVYTIRKNYLSGGIETERETKAGLSEEAESLRREIPGLKESPDVPAFTSRKL